MSYWEPDYEYDPEPNYPEVEEIIEEALDKFEEFIKKQYIDQIRNLNLQKEAVDKLESQILEIKNGFDAREKELNKREQAIQEAEDKLYNKFKFEWFKSLGIDWEVGDIAYTYSLKEIQEECPTCKGTGNVIADINGEKYPMRCPHCGGYAKRVTIGYDYVIKKLRITEVNYRVRKRKVKNELTVSVDKSSYLDESQTYLNAEDEKGNSSQYLAEKLFHTEEKCIKAAKEEIEYKREKLKKEQQ